MRKRKTFIKNCRVIQKNEVLNELAFSVMNAFKEGLDNGKGWAYLYPHDIIYKSAYRDYVKNNGYYSIEPCDDLSRTGIGKTRYGYPE